MSPHNVWYVRRRSTPAPHLVALLLFLGLGLLLSGFGEAPVVARPSWDEQRALVIQRLHQEGGDFQLALLSARPVAGARATEEDAIDLEVQLSCYDRAAGVLRTPSARDYPVIDMTYTDGRHAATITVRDGGGLQIDSTSGSPEAAVPQRPNLLARVTISPRAVLRQTLAAGLAHLTEPVQRANTSIGLVLVPATAGVQLRWVVQYRSATAILSFVIDAETGALVDRQLQALN